MRRPIVFTLFLAATLVALTAWWATADKPHKDHSPCGGHEKGEVHWDIKKGDDISATVKIGKTTIPPSKNEKEVPDIGIKALGETISVEVSDVDEHVCQPKSFPVKNFIEPAAVTVKVYLDEGEKKETYLGDIPLIMAPVAGAKAVLRKWTKKIPEIVDGTSLVGKTIRVQFDGKVTDANCCHTEAVQEKVDLSAYQARMTIIKVLSIQPDSMANLQEMDDGDGNPKTRVFLVPIAEVMEYPVIPVTVRATVAPSLSENQIPDGMTLQGGIGAEKLTRYVSRSLSVGPSKTEFTFDCDGTDSGLKTTVYVYSAKVGLFADKGGDVGHSWGRYSLDAHAKERIDYSYWDYLQEIGFWPSIQGGTDCAGDVRLGSAAVGQHWPTGWKEYPILFSALWAALPTVKASDDNPPWYNLFNYNCTDYAIGLGDLVNVPTMDPSGVSTPLAFSNWLNSH